MTDKEIIADLFKEVGESLRYEVEPLSAETLAWKPDAGANSIGVTVWHVARWLDILGVRILRDGAAEEELWHTLGWRERTGYDPRGIGAGGLGAISGYTQEQVAAIPAMTANQLLNYLDLAVDALRECIGSLPAEQLYRMVPGIGKPHTGYDWVKILLKGCFGHLGEIQALKAMRERIRK